MSTRALCLAIAVFLAAHPGAAQTIRQQSLLVMNRPGSDVAQFKARLTARGMRVLREARCAKDAFSVFEVEPASGSAETALSALKSAKDKDLAAAELKFASAFEACDPHINDPDFDVQWHLDAMNFSEMRCLLLAHNVKQLAKPRVTLIDSGINAIKKELTKAQIREFNFVGGVNGVEETPFVESVSSFHGTAVTSVACATSNNHKFVASPASADKSAQITMCRIGAPPNGTIDTMDVIDAMVWCVDHQDLRGGRGAINMSVNAQPPQTYNASSVVQSIAKSAAKQGDIFVNGAGNSNQLDDSPVTKNFRVIAGLDENNLRWVDAVDLGSVYGNFKAAAPCVEIPYVVPQASKAVIAYNSGTSLAAPCWTSCIALLMSLDPNLTGLQADKIVYQTATVTSEGYHLPDLAAAVNKALGLE